MVYRITFIAQIYLHLSAAIKRVPQKLFIDKIHEYQKEFTLLIARFLTAWYQVLLEAFLYNLFFDHRPHQSLVWRTPGEFYMEGYQKGSRDLRL